MGEQEWNGVVELFIQSSSEECLHLHDFENLEEARQKIAVFIDHYNRAWLLKRHGFRTSA